ncbi:MAG: histidinol-phosphatase [Firmicutes bacterium]|nr:histidinol-phosphatase [Bacillota bacterium]
MRKVNFHTHTYRCNHAHGSDEEYVLEAIRNGYEELGFSDHSCWKYNSDFESHVRMSVQGFNSYKKSIMNLKEHYADQIEIKLGMEAEYFPDYMDWMLDFCIENEVDYLILGNHYDRTDETGVYFGHTTYSHMRDYFELCMEGLRTGMYSYLAHPELILRSVEWDDYVEMLFSKLCRVCKELDIPLEYNVLGMQVNMRSGKEAYPHHKFWELAGFYHNKAIIGMDAHHPAHLSKKLYEAALDNLSQYEVEIIDEIPLKDFKAIKRAKQGLK